MKQLTNFAPSVSAEDNFGKLKSLDYMWELSDAGNQKRILKDFKDQPILINFWATWCPPCLAEMPSLLELQHEYGNKVHFLFVSYEDQTLTHSFLQEHHWNFDSFRPISSEPALLQSNSLPTTFIIDKQGNIVVRKTGNHKWNSKGVKELLDKLIEE